MIAYISGTSTRKVDLCVGPDTAGNLPELLFLQFAADELIIHAMPLRPVFRTYLTGEDS